MFCVFQSGSEQFVFEELLSDNSHEDNLLAATKIETLLNHAVSIGSIKSEKKDKSKGKKSSMKNDRKSNVLNTSSKNIEVSQAKKSQNSTKNSEKKLFYVEKIVDKKLIKGKPYYYVKWKGYSKNNNTWEPRESFTSPALIESFEKELNKSRRQKYRRHSENYKKVFNNSITSNPINSFNENSKTYSRHNFSLID